MARTTGGAVGAIAGAGPAGKAALTAHREIRPHMAEEQAGKGCDAWSSGLERWVSESARSCIYQRVRQVISRRSTSKASR